MPKRRPPSGLLADARWPLQATAKVRHRACRFAACRRSRSSSRMAFHRLPSTGYPPMEVPANRRLFSVHPADERLVPHAGGRLESELAHRSVTSGCRQLLGPFMAKSSPYSFRPKRTANQLSMSGESRLDARNPSCFSEIAAFLAAESMNDATWSSGSGRWLCFTPIRTASTKRCRREVGVCTLQQLPARSEIQINTDRRNWRRATVASKIFRLR